MTAQFSRLSRLSRLKVRVLRAMFTYSGRRLRHLAQRQSALAMRVAREAAAL